MAKVPISIEKIVTQRGLTNTPHTEFLVTIKEVGEKWTKTFRCGKRDIESFKRDLDKLITEITLSEKLGISEEESEQLENLFKTDEICKGCNFKESKKCIVCNFELDSPLERALFKALHENNIYFKVQYGIDYFGNWLYTKNKSFENEHNNFKDVLTIADFYLEKGDSKLCIYTDGHTYHERTEEQAQKDRKIDRKLQELGFTVLRYTGKDVRENLNSIIADVKKWRGY